MWVKLILKLILFLILFLEIISENMHISIGAQLCMVLSMENLYVIIRA